LQIYSHFHLCKVLCGFFSVFPVATILRRMKRLLQQPILPACILFAASVLVYLLKGTNAWWIVHDGLDSEVSFRFLPLEAGVLFSTSNDAIVPQVMNGIPRNCFNASAFNVISWLFWLLPPAWAYLVNTLLVKSIAFTGMWLLLKDAVLPEKGDRAAAAALSLAFALLPVYAIYGITVPGLPLLLWAIWKLATQTARWPWVIVLAYPFYASLVLGGYAVCVLLGLAAVVCWIKKQHSIAWMLMLSTALIGALFLVSEANLLAQFLFDRSYVGHRSDWVLAGYPMKASFYSFYSMFLYGQYHAPSLHQPLLLAVGIAVAVNLRLWLKTPSLLVLSTLIVSFCALYALFKWQPFVEIREKVSLLKTFQFDRFYFLNPVIWFLLAGFAIRTFSDTLSRTVLVTASYVAVGWISLNNHELLSNLSGRSTDGQCSTWNTYYAPQLMETVKKDIGLDPSLYRTVCLGMDPAVPQLAGFYTLDSYQNNYPLAYKKAFRKVIAPGLPADNNFDSWGSKVFIPISGYDDQTGTIRELQIDFEELYELGGRYIFSLLPMDSTSQPVQQVGAYPRAYNGQDFYVYKLASSLNRMPDSGFALLSPVLQ
jgi:hypothetical protein